MMTQRERVLEYMREFGSITPIEAMQDLGCMRLASRIAELKDAGHGIGRRMKSSKNRYGNPVSLAEYYLEEDKHE